MARNEIYKPCFFTANLIYSTIGYSLNYKFIIFWLDLQ